VAESWASAAATLATNTDDVPFALLYTVDGEGNRAKLEQACALARDVGGLSPESIDLASGSGVQCIWPIAAVLHSGQPEAISVRNIEGLPLGPAQQGLVEAIALPLTSRGDDYPVGVLIAGVNATRKLDAEYRTFYELAAGQIAAAIQNARAAEQEKKRIEVLAELDRAKTAFFSNVSHEFRTPLTLMLGPIEELLARSHTDLPPAAKAQLELVNRNGSRLLRLANTLLDFSRIEAGRMRAIYEPTDLSAFTVELAGVFRSAIEKAGLRLELDCPKLAHPVFVDRDMWEKIVLNLIANAFKFTFEGTISVALAQVDNHVELRVRDTGVGIPPQELPRLFDRFHRVENVRSRTHEGSGIGLALVQELVKLHGGSVRAETAIDKGGTFIVSVPLGSAHLPSEGVGNTRTLSTTATGAAPYVEEALRWLPDRTKRRDRFLGDSR
jgi:signal transduction histidine kinase